MSSKVHQFLNELGGNKFTEMAPRPPVPGEENEIQSNGGISTKSSGSLKSHVSTKSHSSGKSITSQCSENNYSPAATPRRSSRSDKSKSATLTQGSVASVEDDDAPMGFEPEGSAANSPPFQENDTPPYLRWARSFKYLLEDGDGVDLFTRYLDDECSGDLNSLNFWFACQGLKAQTGDSNRVSHIIKAIYKIYIKPNPDLKISANVRREIASRLTKNSPPADSDIFNTAQDEVETYMRENSYQSFLKSDLYLEYVQCQGKSPKSTTGSDESSGSNSVRPTSGPLPTLPEDKELVNESLDHSVSLNSTSGKLVTSFTHTPDVSVINVKNQKRIEAISSSSIARSSSSYPVHQTYAPVSIQDSELQSLSSDAPTDDTMSLTDGSVDAIPTNPKAWKQYRRSLQRKAQHNHDTHDNSLHQLIPRTDHAPKDRNIAETDPQKFASLLIERLERLQQERSKEEKMKDALRKCESQGDAEEDLVKPVVGAATLMFRMMKHTSFNEEINADSILEDHCSRVFSTGQHSPLSKTKSPECAHRGSRLIGAANTTFPNPFAIVKPSHRSTKRDREAMTQSYVPSDPTSSGGDVAGEGHRHAHHHSSHHSSSRSRRYETSTDSSLRPSQWYGEQMSRSFVESSIQHTNFDITGRGRNAYRKLSTRKTSENAASADNNVSGDSISIPLSNPSDPNISKVIQWMLSSDIPTGNTTNSAMHSSSSGIATAKERSASSTNPGANSSSSQLPHTQTVPSDLNLSAELNSTVNASHLFSLTDYRGNRKSVPPTQPVYPNAAIKETVIGYYLCGDTIPFRYVIKESHVTLATFKKVTGKRGYRYFFKKASNEFGSGAIFEEISDDNEVLPLFEGKILARVERFEA